MPGWLWAEITVTRQGNRFVAVYGGNRKSIVPAAFAVTVHSKPLAVTVAVFQLTSLFVALAGETAAVSVSVELTNACKLTGKWSGSGKPLRRILSRRPSTGTLMT
jgi:hypothetical protein